MSIAQHKSMDHGSLLNNIIVFLGGLLLSLTHPFHSFTSFLDSFHFYFIEINYSELIVFAIRSVIGGAIALGVKVGGEWLINRMKLKKQTGKEDE